MPTFLNPKRISAGYRACSYIDRDGSAYVWGDAGSTGVLGLGNTTDYSTPTSLSQPGSYPWALINLGKTHSTGIDTNGDAWCWGSNAEGEFGDNSTTSSTSPVAVSGSHTFVKIVPGNYFTVAIDDSGDLYAWGINDNHELGDGTTTPSLVPQLLSSSKTWIDIACGYSWTIALADDGTVWGWGANYWGEAGDGTYETAVTTPQQYSLPSSTCAIAIACFSTGTYSTVYILLSNGQIWGAGCGALGQLGDGTTGTYITSLTRVAPSYTFRSITSGDGSCFGVTTSGVLMAWGEGSDGELGNEASSDSSTPVTVSGDHYFNEYAAGNGVTIAITEFGDQVFTWGSCTAGALGNSETSGSYNYPITIDSPLIAPDNETPLPLVYGLVEPFALPGQASLAVTLPLPYCIGTSAAAGSVTMPLPTCTGECLAAIDCAVTLPLPICEGYSGDAILAVTLPLPTCSGTASYINEAELAVTLPIPTCAGYMAAMGEVEMPLPTCSGAATTYGAATLSTTLPLPKVSGTAIAEGVATLSVTLPLMTATGTITGENVATLAASLPLPTVYARAINNNIASLAIDLYLMTCEGFAAIDNTADLAIELPLPTIYAEAHSSYTDSILRYVRPS